MLNAGILEVARAHIHQMRNIRHCQMVVAIISVTTEICLEHKSNSDAHMKNYLDSLKYTGRLTSVASLNAVLEVISCMD